MAIKAVRTGKKQISVPYRDAKGITRTVKVLGAGSSSGAKIRRAHTPTKVVDNVAAATSMKGTNVTLSRY